LRTLPVIFMLVIQTFFGLSAEQLKPYYIVLGSEGEGMFNILKTMLGNIRMYDEHQDTIAGLRFEFGEHGVYYDEAYGPNWWNYYFEPLDVGSSANARIEEIYQIPNVPPWYIENQTSKERCHELICKYVKVKHHILDKVQAISVEQFHTFTIGIHYRGTDKNYEVARVAYDAIALTVRSVIADLGLAYKDYAIFIATDEEPFLGYMEAQFPNRTTSYQGAYRSRDSQAVHLNGKLNPYKKGEDAIIDCLLLTKCDYLIRTSSNLGLCATYFNPTLPVTVVK
jgi:hypothetical protein